MMAMSIGSNEIAFRNKAIHAVRDKVSLDFGNQTETRSGIPEHMTSTTENIS